MAAKAATKKRRGWAAADYNPRTITERAQAGLAGSMRVFGDLSGFVLNEKTGSVVCGHQRRAALGGIDFAAVRWGPEQTVELGADAKRFKSKERYGFVSSANGARFHVRRVRWPKTFEKAANLAANNPTIEGTFTADAIDMLKEIATSAAQLSEDVGLDALLADLHAAIPDLEMPKDPVLQPKLDEKAKTTCPECGHEFEA